MSGKIDYDGYTIDEKSQILLEVLRDQGKQTAGELADRAGLEDTSSVHHRVEQHVGPTAAGFVDQAGSKPRSGGQPDEIVYGLTGEGEQFVDAHQSELIDVVSAAEAVETLSRIRARIEEFEERVSETEQLVDGNDRWQNRWSTRVNRIESALDELEDTVDEQPSRLEYQYHDQRQQEAAGDYESMDKRFGAIESAIGELSQQIEDLDQRLDETEAALEDRVTETEFKNEIEPLEDRLSADIKTVEKKAEDGLF